MTGLKYICSTCQFNIIFIYLIGSKKFHFIESFPESGSENAFRYRHCISIRIDINELDHPVGIRSVGCGKELYPYRTCNCQRIFQIFTGIDKDIFTSFQWSLITGPAAVEYRSSCFRRLWEQDYPDRTCRYQKCFFQALRMREFRFPGPNWLILHC